MGFLCERKAGADQAQCDALLDSLSTGKGCNGRKCRRNFEISNAVAFLAKSAADVESSLEELSACCESVEVSCFS